MDESTEQQEQQEQLHPLDEPPTQPIQRAATPEPVVTRRGRGLGANRHLSSMLLSLLGVLGAYGAIDYGFYRSLGKGLTVYQGGEISDPLVQCGRALEVGEQERQRRDLEALIDVEIVGLEDITERLVSQHPFCGEERLALADQKMKRVGGNEDRWQHPHAGLVIERQP